MLTRFVTLAARMSGRNDSMRRYAIHSAKLSSVTSKHSPAPKDHDEDDDVNDKPYKYSTSPASKWKARHSRCNDDDDYTMFQTLVIQGSLAAILIYFAILREENDIDLLLSRDLNEIIADIDHFVGPPKVPEAIFKPR